MLHELIIEGWWLALHLTPGAPCVTVLYQSSIWGLHYQFCSQFYEQEGKHADIRLLARNAWKIYEEDLQEIDA